MKGRAELILLYGESDTGKSAQLGQVAKWHYARTGEVSRLISADSGWDSMDPMAFWHPDANPGGYIEAWNVQALADPWGPWTAVTEGHWPHVVLGTDGKPKLRMRKPGFVDGRILASDGKRIVGQYLFEGLSTFGNTGLQDHIRSQRAIGQDIVGKFVSTFAEETEVSGKISVADRSMVFAKAAPSHYGQVQDFVLLDLLPRSGAMPVSRVLWTAHEAKGRDDVTGIENSVLGPAVVGKATVDKTVQKFGHSFHLTIATAFRKGDKGQPEIIREFRAWFVKHPDEVLTRMSWPTKVSLPVDRSAELLRRFPGGYIPLTIDKGIEQFLEFLGEDGGTVVVK